MRLRAYPAWEYRKASPLRDKMVEIYKNMYDKDLDVVAIHAGLECGIFMSEWKTLTAPLLDRIFWTSTPAKNALIWLL